MLTNSESELSNDELANNPNSFLVNIKNNPDYVELLNLCPLDLRKYMGMFTHNLQHSFPDNEYKELIIEYEKFYIEYIQSILTTLTTKTLPQAMEVGCREGTVDGFYEVITRMIATDLFASNFTEDYNKYLDYLVKITTLNRDDFKAQSDEINLQFNKYIRALEIAREYVAKAIPIISSKDIDKYVQLNLKVKNSYGEALFDDWITPGTSSTVKVLQSSLNLMQMSNDILYTFRALQSNETRKPRESKTSRYCCIL